MQTVLNWLHVHFHFQEFTDALSIMTSLANKRQRDLTQSCQRERIVTALSVLKKSMSSLSVVMQNFVKYADNPQAEVSYRKDTNFWDL